MAWTLMVKKRFLPSFILLLALFLSQKINSQTRFQVGLDEKDFFRNCPFKGQSDPIAKNEKKIKKKLKSWKAEEYMEWYSEQKRVQSFESQFVQLFLPQFIPTNDLAKKSLDGCWPHFYELYQSSRGIPLPGNKKISSKERLQSYKDWSSCLSRVYGGRPSKTALRMMNCFKPRNSKVKKKKKPKK